MVFLMAGIRKVQKQCGWIVIYIACVLHLPAKNRGCLVVWMASLYGNNCILEIILFSVLKIELCTFQQFSCMSYQSGHKLPHIHLLGHTRDPALIYCFRDII